jgi:hypothetical protein
MPVFWRLFRYGTMNIALAFAFQIGTLVVFAAICAGLWLLADWPSNNPRLPPRFDRSPVNRNSGRPPRRVDDLQAPAP